jgi:hypothetical protein
MATKNYDNIRVYGDLESEVYFGPKGTVLPDGDSLDPETLDPALEAIGWLSEDGVSLALEANSEKFRGWQGGSVLRTKVTTTDKTITMQALEETPGVTELYFNHGAPTYTGIGPAAIARIDLPESVGTVERAAVFRFVDDDVEKWLVCPLVQVTGRGTVAHQNTSMTIYEFTLEIIGEAWLLTNAPAYIEGAPQA